LERPPVIQITAGRVAQPLEETPAAVTVVTREDIERQQAKSVPDVLRGLPGVTLANQGGPGKQSSLFLRGTESDHVLFLIDGVKVGSATSGTTPIENLPVELVERIEVVRGPRSSLYGSEAIGGVVQVFTRRGAAPGLSPTASVGVGSDGYHEAGAAVAAASRNAWFNGSVSLVETDGFNACTGDPPSLAGCATDEPDRDGYRQRAGQVRLGYRFDADTELDLHALRTRGDTEFDGSFQNESETLQQVVGLGLRLRPMQRWRMQLRAGQSRDEADNFKDDVFATRFDTRRDTLNWQNDLTVAEGHLITLGADYQDDRVTSTTGYTASSRDNLGIFGQYLGNLGAHELQLSLRHDDNEQFGDHVTGNAGWAYPLDDELRASAAYGTAFKAPNFNELYFPSDPVFGGGGNPDLRPETSRSAELGLDARKPWGGWSLRAYQTEIDDLIIASFTTGFVPYNVAEARIRGMELGAHASLANWQLRGDVTLLDAENRVTGKELPRRPRQSARLDIDRHSHRYTLGATLVGAGGSYDDPANTRELDGYVTLDLRAEYRLDRAWRLQGRLVNLFDEDYETAAYYNQPGRSVFVTLRYQPGG
jgi:vitamin B12 transporter